jgi:hypothetical protein
VKRFLARSTLLVFLVASVDCGVDDRQLEADSITLSDDYANRASRQNRSQYRFVFIGNGTSDQDYACMDNNVLTVKYLFP